MTLKTHCELAGTSITMSRTVFGAMTFGAPVEYAEAEAMVHACRDAGVTMFDTSNNYNGGQSEEMVGRAVKPFRQEVLIATKGGSNVEQADPSLRSLNRHAVGKAIDGSLRRLGTDYIDLYYMHRPDRTTPIEETLEALSRAVSAGKIRVLGHSHFAAWQATDMLHVSRAHGWPEVRVGQVMYNLLARRIEAEYVECARTLGFTNIVYNPLAGGLLTGKHQQSDSSAPGTRFAKAAYRDRYWNAVQFEAVERLRQIAADAGLTLVELSLRWVLGRETTGAVLVGASSLAQLRANLAAIDGPALTEDVNARCDDVWTDLLEGVAPKYNR